MAGLDAKKPYNQDQELQKVYFKVSVNFLELFLLSMSTILKLCHGSKYVSGYECQKPEWK